MKYELKTEFDAAKSFYSKSVVEIKGSILKLYSYNTLVAKIIENRTAEVYNTHSTTTLRHIKEFLKQHGFTAINKKQIEEDYIKKVVE